jgi:signal transduction histidine kinase
VLPNPDDPPTALAQRPIHQSIPGDICRQLLSPKRSVACRRAGVLRAAVPKATVNKHGDTERMKNEVRSSEERGVPSPSRDTLAAKQPRQRALGLLVSPRPDSRHHFGAFHLVEYVGHACNLSDFSAECEPAANRRSELHGTRHGLYAAGRGSAGAVRHGSHIMSKLKTRARRSEPVRIPFKLHPRVFAALGADLVTSDVVAVIELVKNSYDAFATRVEVRFGGDASGQPMLEIEDDGSGMTRSVIEDVWCLVATPFRERETKSRRGPYSRRVTGAKGLGRLSAARLGRELEMLTKTRAGECWQVSVEWAGLSQAASLDDCTISLQEGDATQLKGESGTRLRILQLNTDWEQKEAEAPEEKIDELQEGLSRLNPPFEKDDGFAIFLTRPGRDTRPTEIKPSELIENPTYRIGGQFALNGKLIFSYSYKPLSGQGRRSHQEKRWETVLEDMRFSNERARLSLAKPACGPFSFEIRAWDLDGDSVTEAMEHFHLRNKSVVRAEIRAFKGISLYRDAVLVLPKSDTSRDWLGLDLRRVSKTGTRLSTSQIVGYVGVGADTNPQIADTSDRERLARSAQVEEFEALLRYVVTILENERDQDRAQKQPEPTELFRELSAEKLVSEAQELIREKAKVSEIMPLLTRFDDKLQKTRTQVERTFKHYSRLATIGLLAQQLVHEVGNNSSILQEFIEQVKSYFARNGEGASEVRRFLKLAESALQSLHHLAERFRPLANRGFVRGRRKASLRETFDTCLEGRAQEVGQRKVKIDLQLRGPVEVQVDPGELYAVLINLLDNALYWLGRTTEGHQRLLRVESAPARIKGRVECGMHDNGPGVPKEDHERIFWPGFTRRPNGFGMGLSVAGEIVEGYGGKLRILEEGDLGGASFVFDLPEAES